MNTTTSTQETINKFLSTKDIAIIGASRNPKKFGFKAFDLLRKNSFNVYPVHPEVAEIDGIPCYKSVNELPVNIKNAFIVTPDKKTDELLDSVVSRGFEMIWIQQMCSSPTTIKNAESRGCEIISNKCLFMYLNPEGGHKIHRFIMKIFGKL